MTVRGPNNAVSRLRVERTTLARSLELGGDGHGPFGALSYGEPPEVPWMSLYFTVGVWLSLCFVFA